MDLRNEERTPLLLNDQQEAVPSFFFGYKDNQKFRIPAEVRNRMNMITGTTYLIITL